MAVTGGDAVAMIDNNHASVATLGSRQSDGAVGRGDHGRADRCRNVNAGVEGAFPLNGSMRSPNNPVTWPSTGQRLGAELARTQSAVVEFLVRPKEMPTLAAPVSRGVLERVKLVERRVNLRLLNLLGRSGSPCTGFDLSP